VLCWGTAFPLCSITELVAAFPTWSSVTVSEVYSDKSALVIRASASVHI
jgi:hypothetical protein